MAQKFIKAALLTIPDNGDFVAFFDFDRLIKDIRQARNFLMSIRLLTSVPSVLMYWADGDWRYIGDVKTDAALKYLMGMSEDDKARIAIHNAVLTVPTSAPERG